MKKKKKKWNFKKLQNKDLRRFAEELQIMIYQDLLLKNGLKSMINQKKIAVLTKKLESKRQC